MTERRKNDLHNWTCTGAHWSCISSQATWSLSSRAAKRIAAMLTRLIRAALEQPGRVGEPCAVYGVA